MTTIKDMAESYVPTETKNIADLEKVSVNFKLETKTVKEGTEDEFSYEFITIDGEEYRVPKSVIKQLQTLLEDKPDMEYFKVVKKGEGLKTTYTVMYI